MKFRYQKIEVRKVKTSSMQFKILRPFSFFSVNFFYFEMNFNEVAIFYCCTIEGRI